MIRSQVTAQMLEVVWFVSYPHTSFLASAVSAFWIGPPTRAKPADVILECSPSLAIVAVQSLTGIHYRLYVRQKIDVLIVDFHKTLKTNSIPVSVGRLCCH